MTNQFMDDYLDRAWSTDPSKRTILYYAFLLARANLGARITERDNFCSRLREMSTVESGDFDAILHEFAFFKIVKSSSTCVLTEDALGKVEELIAATLGSSEPVPFDGLDIYENNNKRYKRWVEAGSDCIEAIFKDVEGIKFQRIEIGRKRGCLLIIQTDVSSPFFVFYFINTPRMKQMSELEPVRACAEEVLFQRMRDLEGSGATPQLNGLKPITIVAAPTYSTSTAGEAAYSQMPTRLIGPVNLAALQKYFMNDRRCCRNEQYNALLRFFDPVAGGIRGGIIFSNWILEYLERELREIYRLNGC